MQSNVVSACNTRPSFAPLRPPSKILVETISDSDCARGHGSRWQSSGRPDAPCHATPRRFAKRWLRTCARYSRFRNPLDMALLLGGATNAGVMSVLGKNRHRPTGGSAPVLLRKLTSIGRPREGKKVPF